MLMANDAQGGLCMNRVSDKVALQQASMWKQKPRLQTSTDQGQDAAQEEN